jgi:hypothetical protein
MAKAQHRKVKHVRRVAHQRIQKQRKLDAINESVEWLGISGDEVNAINLSKQMNECGYFYMGLQFGDTLFTPRVWKRMPKPPKKKRTKVLPS